MSFSVVTCRRMEDALMTDYQQRVREEFLSMYESDEVLREKHATARRARLAYLHSIY